jgi:Helix-turn-helix domain
MRQLAPVAESDRKIALDRYRLLQPHLEDGRTLSVVASEAGVAYSTAQRWVSLYRRFGLSALVRKRRSDRGQRRALSAKLRQVSSLHLIRSLLFYSRNALIGSIRVARRAGSRHASSAASASINTAAQSESGSVVVTPYKRLSTKRARMSAAMRPTTKPSPTIFTPCSVMNLRISLPLDSRFGDLA